MPANTITDRYLRTAAARLGIQLAYWDVAGSLRPASPEAVRAVVEALDVDPAAPPSPVEPVAVAWGGRLRLRVRTDCQHAGCWVRREDGQEAGWWRLPLVPRGGGVHLLSVPQTLPFGVHEARVELQGESHRCVVLSAPSRLSVGRGGWGVFAPVYALWSHPGQPVGDFADLAELARWIAARGGKLLSTLPLLPVFPHDPSPYRPVSRLVWNEVFVHLPHLRGSCSGELVDYQAAFARKRARLEELAQELTPAQQLALRNWLDGHPHVQDYARFRALSERLGPWRGWPAELRGGRVQASAEPTAVSAYAYAQWLADAQVQDAARSGCGLYLDFPLGVHPDGYDAWRFSHLFAEGISVGAPPDPFSPLGQNWGFAPLHPLKAREDGYAYLRRCLAHHFRVCRLLRVDHVMGLHRLYWIPRGFPASEGVYVRYPADELYALLLLEAWRRGGGVVGEDLGTVTRAVRRRLERHGVLRMYVLAFELHPDRGPAPPSANVVASLGTHDTAPFASFWTGEDLGELFQLGLLRAEELEAARDARAARVRAAARALGVAEGDLPQALRACLCFLAESAAAWVVVNLEDLWLERRRHNLPGTAGSQHPNWRRRMEHSLAGIFASPVVQHVLEEVQRARASARGPGRAPE